MLFESDVVMYLLFCLLKNLHNFLFLFDVVFLVFLLFFFLSFALFFFGNKIDGSPSSSTRFLNEAKNKNHTRKTKNQKLV